MKRTKKEHAIRQKALQDLAEDKKREQKLALPPRKAQMLTCANNTRASNTETTTTSSPVKESVLATNEKPTSNTISLRNIAHKEKIEAETVSSESTPVTTQSNGDNKEGMTTTTRIAQDSSVSEKDDKVAVHIEGWIVTP